MSPKKRKNSDVCKVFLCPHDGCEKKFNRPYRLRQHVSAAHIGQKEFSCPESGCQKVYASKYKLHLHLRNHHKCSELLSEKEPLDLTVKDNDPLTVIDPNQKSNAQHDASKSNSLLFKKMKKIKCQHSTCQKMYANKHSMLKHYRNFHLKGKGLQYFCQDCNSAFRTRTGIEDHWNSHLGLKPYKCEICLKLFSSRRLLTKHKPFHNKLKCPHPNCDSTYGGKELLKYHYIQCHPNAGNVACDQCGLQFQNKLDLIRHIKGQHFPTSKFPGLHQCMHCTRVYQYKRNLVHHINVRHNFLRIPCSMCDKTFSAIQTLKKHLKIHEPGYSSNRTYPVGSERKRRKDLGVRRNSIAKLLAGAEPGEPAINNN
ncbi:zinc finger protein 782-like [Neocloeon triangulifer]|uniref:zinc finger protein 782-like n=1 Tax=Neocloeon triangulifer TaxID=2078957 RepID=UPI00286ED245|nr:zinc finger protein 782-like [Neocloeon triangulifer]